MSHVIRFWLILSGTVLKQWFLPETFLFQALADRNPLTISTFIF